MVVYKKVLGKKLFKYNICYIGILISIIFGLQACGSSEVIDDSYKKAKSIEALKIPEGMESPRGRNEVVLPNVDKTSTSESLSELQKPPQILSGVELEALNKETTDKKDITSTQKSESDNKLTSDLDSEFNSETRPVNAEKQVKSDSPARNSGLSNESSPQKPLSAAVTTTPDGTRMLIVNKDFATIWPMLGSALEELGFDIEDGSRGNRVYTVVKNLPVTQFDSKKPHPGDEKGDIREEFQVQLKEVDDKTQLTVHNKYGKLEGSGLADHLLLQIEGILESTNK